MDGSVWLVGMMGAGKSAVGPILARRLGRRFLDADAEIERRTGCSISEIFEEEGEAGFRRRERRWIEEWAGKPLVIALGGGAVAQPGVADRCRETGTVVWLRARAETLAERVGGEGRPLLAGLSDDDRRAFLGRLLRQREPCYATARVVVDVDEADPTGVAEQIAERLEAIEGASSDAAGGSA